MAGRWRLLVIVWPPFLSIIVLVAKKEEIMRRSVWLTITLMVILSFLPACTPAAPTVVPTKPSAPAAATAPVSATPSTPPVVAAATKPAAPAISAYPAATASPAPAVKVKRGGTLKVANGEEYQPNLDPHQITVPCFGYDTVFSNLTRMDIDPKTGKRTFRPGLADSWEQPAQNKIVMKLQKKAVFHDGSAWNAEVAKWNLDRMRTYPKAATKTDMAVIDSVDIIDESTIRLNLKGAPAGLLERLSDGLSIRAWMTSKAAVDKNGDDYLARTAVGSGPMQFVEWMPGDHMTLKKFDKYWENGVDSQPLPYLDGIAIRLIIDETVRTNEVRTGNMDLAMAAHPRNFAAIRSSPKQEVWEYEWNASVHYNIFNMTKPPFGGNAKLRQAAMYAIDRESMAKTVGLGSGYPVYYYWGSADLGYDETLPRYKFDQAKAKQLVKDAGFPNGLDVTNTYFTPPQIVQSAEILKNMWDAIGIRTTLEVLERAAFVPKLQTANYQVANSTREWGSADPDDYSLRLVSEATANFAHFKNTEFDKCMEEGRNAVESAKRADIYKKCQKILIEEVPYGEMWSAPKNLIISKDVRGWKPHLFNITRLSEVWLDR
jgi:peptide/nickel transport system substrate-binding protein